MWIELLLLKLKTVYLSILLSGSSLPCGARSRLEFLELGLEHYALFLSVDHKHCCLRVLSLASLSNLPLLVSFVDPLNCRMIIELSLSLCGFDFFLSTKRFNFLPKD